MQLFIINYQHSTNRALIVPFKNTQHLQRHQIYDVTRGPSPPPKVRQILRVHVQWDDLISFERIPPVQYYHWRRRLCKFQLQGVHVFSGIHTPFTIMLISWCNSLRTVNRWTIGPWSRYNKYSCTGNTVFKWQVQTVYLKVITSLAVKASGVSYFHLISLTWNFLFKNFFQRAF